MKAFALSLLALALAAPFPAPVRADSPPGAAAATDIRAKETFAIVWERLQNSGFKGEHEQLDWAALKAEHQPDIENAKDIATLRLEIGELLDAMKASHLSLIPAEAFPKDGETPKSGTGDLGLRLVVLDRGLAIERVIPGSPAERAGIRPGWTVAKIDAFDVAKAYAANQVGELLKPRGMSMMQLLANRRVAAVTPGATVALELRDFDGAARSLSLTAVQDPNTQTVAFAGLPPMPLRFAQRVVPLRGGGCALYVEYSQWAMPVYDQLVAALREHGDCAGVVIDLRGNSGGLMASMSAVGGLFFDKPVSLGTLTTSGGDLRLNAFPRQVTDDGRDVRRFQGPLAILTDRGSISCSDIFPASMQALERARIFGDTSAGMALPAGVAPLPSGDRLYYPIAEFVDSNGRRIEGVGVIPDTPAVPTAEALRAGRDPALDAALAWIGQSAGPSK
jgi:carboxyl-terminal processing protease